MTMLIDVDEVMNMVMAMSDDGTTCCTRMLDEGNLRGTAAHQGGAKRLPSIGSDHPWMLCNSTCSTADGRMVSGICNCQTSA